MSKFTVRTLRRTIFVATVCMLLLAAPVFSAIVETAVVPTGDSPSALSVNPVSHTLYSADYFGNSVSVIDGLAYSRMATLSVGTGLRIPNAVVVDSLASPARAFVANFWAGTISVIDESALTVTSTVLIGGGHGAGSPRALAIDPSGAVHKLYVAEYGTGNVSVWDAETYQLIKRIPVGKTPRGLGIFSSVGRKRIYALNAGSNSVSVIDGETDAVIATLATGLAPKAVAVDASTGWAWVTNEKGNSVTAIDASDTVAGTIAVGSRPIGIAVDSAAGRIFVANTASNNVTVIRTADMSVETTLSSGLGPWAVAVDPAGGRTYVSCFTSDTVDVIDGALGVRSVPVGDGPYSFAVDDSVSPTRVYVANRNADSVSVLVDDGLAFMPSNTTAYAVGLPAANIVPLSATQDSVTHAWTITGTASSIRRFPASILRLELDIDGTGTWLPADIIAGAGTESVTWQLDVPSLAPGSHLMKARVIDQTSVTCASSDGGSADKGASTAVALSRPLEVASGLPARKGTACAGCHTDSSRGKRPNGPPAALTRCPRTR